MLQEADAHGSFDGVDEIIDLRLTLWNVGTRQPHYGNREACRDLNRGVFEALGAEMLIKQMLDQVRSNLASSTRTPSEQNWRFDKQLKIAEGNPSREKTLEKAIVRLDDEDQWANQIPTASGLVSPTADRSRNIDLVYRRAAKEFEFIELKRFASTQINDSGVAISTSRHGWRPPLQGNRTSASKRTREAGQPHICQAGSVGSLSAWFRKNPKVLATRAADDSGLSNFPLSSSLPGADA
jgi:hypothetical protein